ncbi:MAG: N-acetylmuramoyl-L-alanine amidase [Anaerolineaceae bacterium]|nr:MAG: N-acetylmuramoyl-L-alanine amidase [Anaerolineaceae bacterium]
MHKLEGYKDLIGISNGVHNIDNGVSESYGNIYSVSKDYSKVKPNTDTYAIFAEYPFSIVTSEVVGRQINLHISNMKIIDNTYYVRSLSGGMIESIQTSNVADKSCNLEFNILSDKFTYDLALSDDKRTLYITIYYNSLNTVTIGTNDSMDYITLTGNYPLNVITNDMSGILYIEMPGTKKSMDDQYININNSKSIYFVNLFHTSENTYLYMGLENNDEYYIVQDGNSYTIMLPTKDKPFTPPIPQVPDKPVTPVNPENPINDHSKYELVIPNPAGLTVSQIKHEDQYSRLRFAIRLPGDYTSYLNVNSILINSNVIKDVSVFLNSNRETEILVTTSVLQGYEIFADQDYIYINVDNPRAIYKNIVVLDPGHGGPAPGARYFNTNEKSINFKILYEIGKDYFNSNPSQLKVYYTRESDVDVSLANRAAFANAIGADLFVSLHMNANTNTSVYGTEVYYSNNNNKRNKAGLNSETLAKLFVNNLSGSLGTNNRGTRAANYTVVHKNTVPAVLVELGFMSNKNDFAKISDPTFQYKAAKVLYETILQVFELYPTGR